VVKLRGKGFVASYSSATVAEFHGVPCADVSFERTTRTLTNKIATGKRILPRLSLAASRVRRDAPVKFLVQLRIEPGNSISAMGAELTRSLLKTLHPMFRGDNSRLAVLTSCQYRRLNLVTINDRLGGEKPELAPRVQR
jgi:hypothetical protein